jgi:signal peptidase I
MEENKQNQPKSSFWELIKYVLIALLIVIPFRYFIAQPYVVEGSSMDPTFKNADYLIVDQLSKRFEELPRESVVIIKFPLDTSKFFIKRLIGLPGDMIEIKDGKVFVNNIKTNEPYIVYDKKENFSKKLGVDEYFVMGDNRAGSYDSRMWGTLPKIDIVGRPFLRLLPLNKIAVWPGLF